MKSLQALPGILFAMLFVFAMPLYAAFATLWPNQSQSSGQSNERMLIADDKLSGKSLEFDTDVFDEPVVSVVFDDGWESAYQSAFPVMESLGIESTQFIITGTFDNPLYMSREQIVHMMQHGHEIGSHTISHVDLTQQNSEVLENELHDSRSELESLTMYPVEDLAVPLGSTNDAVKTEAKKWYRSLRTTHTGVNTATNFDAYNLRAFTLKTDHSIDDIKKLLDEAKANNGWLILTYHQIDETGSTYAVTPAEFKRQMQYLIDQGVDIVPYGRVLNDLKQGL